MFRVMSYLALVRIYGEVMKRIDRVDTHDESYAGTMVSIDGPPGSIAQRLGWYYRVAGLFTRVLDDNFKKRRLEDWKHLRHEYPQTLVTVCASESDYTNLQALCLLSSCRIQGLVDRPGRAFSSRTCQTLVFRNSFSFCNRLDLWFAASEAPWVAFNPWTLERFSNRC